MRKVAIIFLVIINLATVSFAAYKYFSPRPQLVGSDSDSHGCIGSAGYSWCEIKQKCLRVWEEPCSLDTDDPLKSAVGAAISAKYNQPADSNIISVSQTEGDYAKGLVNPSTPGPGGGLWFAAKVDGTWKLVWDGNGIITCDDIAAYPEFPSSLIPQCFDSSSQAMISR